MKNPGSDDEYIKGEPAGSLSMRSIIPLFVEVADDSEHKKVCFAGGAR